MRGTTSVVERPMDNQMEHEALQATNNSNNFIQSKLFLSTILQLSFT